MRKIPTIPKRALPDMNLASFGEWDDQTIDETVELVHGLIPLVGCGFFAGIPKCGKTWGVLDLALAAITGQPYFGRETSTLGRPVLYVAGEGGVARLLQRIRWLACGRDIPLSQIRDTLYLSIAPRILLDRGTGMAALEAAIKQLDPGLVIIDPLTRFHMADENSRSDIDAPILTPLRQLSEEYCLCIMLVHHSKKWGKGAFDPLRGTSAFQGWYDFLLYYEPVEVEPLRNGEEDEGMDIDTFQFCASLRDNESPPKREVLTNIDSINGWARIALVTRLTRGMIPKVKTLEDKILDFLKHNDAASRRKVAEGTKRSHQDVNTAIQKLLDSGKIENYNLDGVEYYRVVISEIPSPE